MKIRSPVRLFDPFPGLSNKSLEFSTAASMTLGFVPETQRLVISLQLERALDYPFSKHGVVVVVWCGGAEVGSTEGFLL